MAPADTGFTRVFISYSDRDKRWLERLKVHLTPLKRDYEFDWWDDTRLIAGTQWRQEIDSALEQARVAILLISADFLASQFIFENELPPLLAAAADKGVMIMPVIVNHSLFSWNAQLSRFQPVNSPETPLVAMTDAEQERLFVKVAEAILEKATPVAKAMPREPKPSPDEQFLDRETWLRLVKIGDWIFDEQQKCIIGAGPRSYLLSRGEYGETCIEVGATLRFSNFSPPAKQRLGMNSGIIFGWKSENGVHRYKNLMLTGSELLLEAIGNKGGDDVMDFEHLTEPEPLIIETGRPYTFDIRVTDVLIEVRVNGKLTLSAPRPLGFTGRVGLRPWRSQIDCTAFSIRQSLRTNSNR